MAETAQETLTKRNWNQKALESCEHYKATSMHVSHEDMAAWLSTWGTDKEGSCPKSRT